MTATLVKILTPLSVAILLQVPVLAQSEEGDTPTQSDDNVIVSIASRTPETADDLPLSISVVSESELNLIGHTHIQETLNRIPGVNFHRGNGQEYLPSIRSQVFTGAGGCGALLILEDNIPVRPAGFCNINELFEVNTELASQIEVIRGTGTVYYGSNALHGVINIVTPSPEEGGRFSVEAGENGLYRSTLRTGYEGEAHKLGLSVIGARYEGWRDESSYDQQKLALRHEYTDDKLRIQTGLSSTNLNQETAGFIAGENAYEDLSLSRMNLDTEGFRDVQSFRLWSRFEMDFEEDKRLVITSYVRQSDMNFMMHFLPGDPVEENGQDSFGVLSNIEVQLDNTVLRTGLDIEFADTYLRQTQANPTPGSAFLQATIPAGKQYDYQVDSALYSVFADLNTEVSQYLSVGAGVRWENLEYDYDNQMNSGRLTEDGQTCGFGGCRYNRPEDSVNSFDNWSVDFNAHYSLSDIAQLFFRLSRAFRAPQATELYRLQRAQTIADLEPENIKAVEVGYRKQMNNLSVEMVAYRMNKKNVIFRNVDFFNVSDGQTKHTGLELELNYSWDNGWYWDLVTGYARHVYDYDSIQNDINFNGLDIDTAPRYSANNRIGWTNDVTHIELEWIKADDYFLEPTNQFSYEGHDLIHLMVAHQLSSRIEIKGRVHNLFDKRYAERADYTSFTAYRYFPGTPRQVSLTFSYLW